MWHKLAPPTVAAKLELARRWLALHIRFLHLPGKEERVGTRDDGVGSHAATDGGGGGRLGSEQQAIVGGGSSGQQDDAVTGMTPAAASSSGPSRIPTDSSAASMLRAADALKLKLARNMAKMGDLFYSWDLDGNVRAPAAFQHAPLT